MKYSKTHYDTMIIYSNIATHTQTDKLHAQNTNM